MGGPTRSDPVTGGQLGGPDTPLDWTVALAQFRPGLYRYLLHCLRNSDSAEELAQEVYLRLLRVENQGPPLPEAIRDSLFDSMVSQRAERKAAVPHLGLGPYIARLIAEFHGGRLRAENLPGGGGVAFEVALARAL